MGGRSVHLPRELARRFVRDDAGTRARVAALLEHPDFRCVHAAAWILAEEATHDGCFAALWAARARPLAGLSFALARAAELRRDPALLPDLEHLRAAAREPTLRTRWTEVITALPR